MPSLTTPALATGALAGLPQPVLPVPGGLTLRPWVADDAAAVAAAYTDPGIRQWHARSMTGEEALAWIASWRAAWAAETGASWAVADGAHVVGQVGLRGVHLPEARADLSYWVRPAAYPAEGTRRRVALHADGWHDRHLHARLHDDPPRPAA